MASVNCCTVVSKKYLLILCFIFWLTLFPIEFYNLIYLTSYGKTIVHDMNSLSLDMNSLSPFIHNVTQLLKIIMEKK